MTLPDILQRIVSKVYGMIIEKFLLSLALVMDSKLILKGQIIHVERCSHNMHSLLSELSNYMVCVSYPNLPGHSGRP